MLNSCGLITQVSGVTQTRAPEGGIQYPNEGDVPRVRIAGHPARR